MPSASSPGSLFGSPQEEQVQDAESVWRQQEAHQQPSCTLDECFQFYTKEEQVSPGGRVHARGCEGGGWPRCGGAGCLTVPVVSFPAGSGRCVEVSTLQGPPAGHGEAESLDLA